MAKKSASPVNTGVDPREEKRAKTQWLTLEPNSSVDGVILVEAEEIMSYEQCAIWLDTGASPIWVYTGPNDPCHDLGTQRRYRACLPIVVEGEVKVWSMSKTAHSQLLDVADANGELKGMEVRIKRTGSGLTTRYSLVPKGKRHDVSRFEEPDILSMLGPLTAEGAKTLIAERLGKANYEQVLEAFTGATTSKMGKVSFDESEDKEVVLSDFD